MLVLTQALTPCANGSPRPPSLDSGLRAVDTGLAFPATTHLEASMYWMSYLVGVCLVVIALLAIYVPTVYIRKTNVMIHLLEQIAANTRK